MKLLSRLLRRKPSKPTPEEGRAILEKAIEQTLDSGLQGYILGQISDDSHGHFIFKAKGNLVQAMSEAFKLLLSSSETKEATLAAIVTALRASGSATEVQIMPADDDDCDCPLCTARRMKEGPRQATTKPH
jgi:hypothetical protein